MSTKKEMNMSNDKAKPLFTLDVTDEHRKQFFESLDNSPDGRWDGSLIWQIECMMRDDPDGIKSTNILFRRYFDKEFDYWDDLPWREVADQVLVSLIGTCFLTTAKDAGLIEENEDG